MKLSKGLKAFRLGNLTPPVAGINMHSSPSVHCFAKLMCLSPAHLAPATRRFLSANSHTNWPTIGGPFGDSGWIFHVDEDAATNFGDRRFKELWRIFAYAAERGYDLVLFDFVEDPIGDLPVYS